MKNPSEFGGVIGLWMLGMVTAYPETWPVCGLLALALMAAFLIAVYGYQASQQSKSGDQHYAQVALLGVFLTVASLAISAWRIEGGKIFLAGLLVTFLLVVVGFLYNERRKRVAKSRSSQGPRS